MLWKYTASVKLSYTTAFHTGNHYTIKAIIQLYSYSNYVLDTEAKYSFVIHTCLKMEPVQRNKAIFVCRASILRVKIQFASKHI